MRLDKQFKLDRAILKDAGYVAMGNASLEGNTLIGTTGRILARVPVEISPEDTDGLIPRAAIVALQRRASVEAEVNGQIVVKTMDPAGMISKMSFERGEGTFPSHRRIAKPSDGSPEYQITFNPRFLWDLAQALGASGNGDGVTLQMFGDGLPVVVTPAEANGAEGFLMPMQLETS